MKDLNGFRDFGLRADPRLAALAREGDPEMRAFGLLALGRDLKVRGRDAAAAEIFSSLLAADVPGAILSSAQRELDAMTGRGNAGLRWEYLASRFVRDAADPGMILPMMAGTAVYGVLRAGAAFRLGRAGGFFSRGAAQRLAAAVAGSAGEIPAFVFSQRLFQDPEARSGLGEDLGFAALTLGCLKAAAGGLSVLRPASGGFGFLNRGAAPALATLGGLAAGRYLATQAGLREASAGETAAVDLMAAALSLGVGGHLGRSLLGRGFAQFSADLNMRSVNPRPPSPWQLTGQEAFAGGRLPSEPVARKLSGSGTVLMAAGSGGNWGSGPLKPTPRKYFHVRQFRFTHGFEQKVELPAADEAAVFRLFTEAETEAEFQAKLERLKFLLGHLPPQSLNSFRRMELYEKPSVDYGYERMSGQFSLFPGAVRIFDFSRRSNTELIDILTHEIVGHGLLLANRSEAELKMLKVRILKAVRAARPETEEFYRNFTGSEHYRSNWMERFAAAVTLYRISPNSVRSMDPAMVEVIEEVLDGYVFAAPGVVRTTAEIREEIAGPLAFPPRTMRNLIREIVSPHVRGSTVERFQTLAELGSREDFEEFPDLFNALQVLAKRQNPVDFHVLVEALQERTGVEVRKMGDRFRFMQDKARLRAALDEHPLAGFLAQPIQQALLASDGPRELENLLVKLERPRIGNAVLLMETIGKVATNPHLKEPDSYLWMLQQLKETGDILQSSALFSVEIGEALLAVITHPNFRGERNLTEAVSALPYAVHEENLGIMMSQAMGVLLEHPEFVLADHLDSIARSIRMVLNPAFRLTMWRELLSHKQFRGEENFAHALREVTDEAANVRRILAEETAAVRRLAILALGDMGGNPHCPHPEKLIGEILVRPGGPAEKTAALVAISRNPRLKDSESWRDLIDGMLRLAVNSRQLEADLHLVLANPYFPEDVRQFFWMELNRIDPAMARRFILAEQSRRWTN